MNTKLAIKINDEKVPAKDFAQQIIGRANLGYIANLKDVSLKPGDYVAIDIKIPGETIDDMLEEDLGLSERLSITINDKKIPIGKFVTNTFLGMNLGMLSTLKKTSPEPGTRINISIKVAD